MIHPLVDQYVVSGLGFLGEWSLRWGVVLAAVAAGMVLKPPHRATSRYAVLIAALAAGLLLPVGPRWGGRLASRLLRPGAGSRVVIVAERGASIRTDRPRAHLVETGHHAPVVRETRAGASPGAGQGARSQRERDVPRKRPAIDTWMAAAVGVGALWLATVLALGVRVVGGQVLVRRLRRQSHQVEGTSARLLEECRRAVGLGRRVTLATHPAIGSPVATGGRRPRILVPADWDAWDEGDRRACLLHELAHLARCDDWAKLVQELVRVPFFFHPLVRWLLVRLDRERELICDEAVVALGTDPVVYARLLLEMARRPGRLPKSPLHGPAVGLPFLDRRTVATRIERLLEDDMNNLLRTPPDRRGYALGALALAAALGLGGFPIHADEPPPREAARPHPPRANGGQPAKAARTLSVQILDPDDAPVANARVVAGYEDGGPPDHQDFRTDREGWFEWTIGEGPHSLYFVAHKEGFAPTTWTRNLKAGEAAEPVEWRLGRLEPFSATLVDERGRTVGGARVRIEMAAFGRETPASPSRSGGVSTCFTYIRRAIVEGSSLESLFSATTDDSGAFTLVASWVGAWLKLAVTTADGKEYRVQAAKADPGILASSMARMGFVAAPPGAATRLVAVPAARIVGRVATRLPGVRVAGMRVSYQDSHPPGKDASLSNFGGTVATDAEGRFVFGSLSEGTVNIVVHGEGENQDWTYRAANDVTLIAGKTAEAVVELIRGVEVEGTVIARGSDRGLADARVGMYGPFRPRTSAMTQGAKTDDRGHFRYRLPAGETYFYVMGMPGGYTNLPQGGSTRTVVIPEDVDRYELPPLELAAALTVSGRIVDAAGLPVVGASVVGICEGNRCVPFADAHAVTDANGAFRLPTGWNNTIPVGQVARLLIHLRDGKEIEAAAVPGADGSVRVQLAEVGVAPPAAQGPHEVADDEIAGVVIGPGGKPLEGVEIEATYWIAKHPRTQTDARGEFRIRKLGEKQRYGVRVRKEGYATREYLLKQAGEPGWVIVLDDATYFEGRVLAADGSPVAGALICADAGPVRENGSARMETLTETRSRQDGRYRLHVVPGIYNISVRLTGVGSAAIEDQAIAADEHRTLDWPLARGSDFAARVVDRQTGGPIAGLRLWHWERPGIEGVSDNLGVIRIPDVPPGVYNRFEVEAPGYVRWWSDACLTEWTRYRMSNRSGFQRNFNSLDFDVKPGMEPVTIELERGVLVRGRVVDPDDQPVAGATVAPALTGTGNSLTGDTRFSVETDAGGRYVVLLPASGDAEYNLIAHDGKYVEGNLNSRIWANGVTEPFRTAPGQQVDVPDIRLTRPATVTGRVLDAQGRPVAGREVRAHAADLRENRYYDPSTTTRADGTYELRRIRPGEQFIQVAPFYPPKQAPEGTCRRLKLEARETKGDLDLVAESTGVR